MTASSAVTVPSGITATPGTGATAGSYSILVSTVASAAKARSTGFLTTNDTVAGGTIGLTVKGVVKSIAITAGSDLGSVVNQINQAAVGVTAAVVSNGTNFFVSLTNKETGKPIGSGVERRPHRHRRHHRPGLRRSPRTPPMPPSRSTICDIESQTNEVTSAIPGVTLSIKAQQLTPGELVISRDTDTSGNNVQGFVDSYNAIMNVLKKSLRPDPKAGPNTGDRPSTAPSSWICSGACTACSPPCPWSPAPTAPWPTSG